MDAKKDNKTHGVVRVQRSRPGHRGVGGVVGDTKSLQITGVQENTMESKTEPSYGGDREGPKCPRKTDRLGLPCGVIRF